MEEFMSLIQQDGEFCIPHSYLQKYGVININDSSKIKRCLDVNDLVEGVDYQLSFKVEHIGNIRADNRIVSADQTVIGADKEHWLFLCAPVTKDLS